MRANKPVSDQDILDDLDISLMSLGEALDELNDKLNRLKVRRGHVPAEREDKNGRRGA